MRKRISAGHLQDVLNQLPRTNEFAGDYYRVLVRRAPESIAARGARVCKEQGQIFEFEKSEDGREWLLASVPKF